MSKRILVVEDHADNRQIIRDMLAPTDYEITEAENGEEALAAIAKQRPDLPLRDAVFAACFPFVPAPPREKDQEPKVCPHCKSPYWDRPRQSKTPPVNKRSRKKHT
jgi:Response regulator receiver domain